MTDKKILRKQTNITDSHPIDYIEYYRSATGTYRCHDCRTSRFSGVHWSHCSRGNVIQYYLLDFWIPAHGNKRNDFTSVRSAWFKRNHPVTTTFCWSRIIYSTLPVDTPIPYPETGIYTDTNHTGGQATGNNLFLHLHLGSPSHIRALWIRRLVYRDAEFTFSHVYRYYSKYCQHCSQSMFCLLIGHENGRSGNRNFNCPICRFLHGYFVIHALL